MVTAVSDAVDVTRAVFDRDQRRLVLTLGRRSGIAGTGRLWSATPQGELTVEGQPAGPNLARRDGDLMTVRCPEGGAHDVILTLDHWDPSR
ncbi:hypothetical protein LY13_004797 [Prauserella aidingensis]|nr:hypothetical protein [Prauserella aidingensis]